MGMKETDSKVVAEMQLARFVQKTHGLKLSEMYVRTQMLLEQTDQFTLLRLIDDMMDDLQRNGVRALGANSLNLSKREALARLGNLRLWWVMNHCRDLVDACDKVSELLQRVAVLEAENEAQKAQLNDGWTNRVTYENVVEKIASYEDVAARDRARNMIEPMLKRDMVRKFREDVKRKVQEQNVQEDPGSSMVIKELVMHKQVETEIQNVEKGGIGINKDYHKA